MSISMHSLFKLKTTWLAALAIAAVLLIIAISQYSNLIGDNNPHIRVDVDEKSGISVFHTEKPEKGLLIYIGDNSHVNSKNSREFANLSYYVAQIAPQTLLSLNSEHNGQPCINIAEKVQDIAVELQQKYAIAKENLPILVGSNEGAAVVYTALAQSDKKTFHAGISLNFSARLSSKIPFCAVHNFASNSGEPHADIFPVKHLPTSWYIFQNSTIARDPDSNQFIANISNTKLTASATAKADSIAEAIQILQWLDPRLTDQISSDHSNTDLPLIEVFADRGEETPLAVLLTGDGGWAEIDKKLAKLLADKGIPTVALDSLSYFWKARTPQETAKDVDNIISLYSDKWHKKHVILIGYSFGADVLPFIANQLSQANKNKLALVALLGMGHTAAFEFHLSSWMNADTSEHRLPLLPEVDNMRWANSICIYGLDDESTACGETRQLGVKVISMKGGHHFNENYDLLLQHILDNVKIPTDQITAEQ